MTKREGYVFRTLLLQSSLLNAMLNVMVNGMLNVISNFMLNTTSKVKLVLISLHMLYIFCKTNIK